MEFHGTNKRHSYRLEDFSLLSIKGLLQTMEVMMVLKEKVTRILHNREFRQAGVAISSLCLVVGAGVESVSWWVLVVL